MGCDIHMVLERKINDEWVGVHNYHGIEAVALRGVSMGEQQPHPSGWVTFKIRERNYTLFGELAGVRTDGTLGNEPRGLPDNMSQLTRVETDEWDGDGHSHSYLSLPEFVAAYAAATDQTALLVEHRLHPSDETYKKFHELCTLVTGYEIYDNKYDEFRICFWFDN